MENSQHFFSSWHLTRLRAFSLTLAFFGIFSLWACQPPNRVMPTPGVSPSPLPAQATATPAPLPAPIDLPASPTPARCTETIGVIEKGIIETPLLDKPMRYNVYLPPCYGFNAQKRYPVLYLLHGQNYDENQWLRIGAASSADELVNTGEISPFLIVMPYDYSYKQPSGYNFEQVFLEMLLPRIEAAYRILPGAANRAAGGLSRGGAWTIHFGLRHPEMFGALGAHSPAIFYGDMDTLRVRLRDADKDHFPRFFIDVGDRDSGYETVIAFENLLNQANIPHEWHAYLGFHEEKYWSAHVEEYLRWYAAGWQ